MRIILIACLMLCPACIATEAPVVAAPTFGEVAMEPGERLFDSFLVHAKVTILEGSWDRMIVSIDRPIPAYPPSLLNAGVVGQVTVTFMVSADGTTSNLSVENKTTTEFEEACRAAVSKWRFQPPQYRGKSTTLRLRAKFVFSMFTESSISNEPVERKPATEVPDALRRRRNSQVRPAILADNAAGTKNIGVVSNDPHWASYGQYLQRMIDSVQMRWESQLIKLNIYPASGSTVKVRFVINSQGRVASIKMEETTATEPASRACVSAIADCAPYGEWSEDMKKTLGGEQEMIFTFLYQ